MFHHGYADRANIGLIIWEAPTKTMPSPLKSSSRYQPCTAWHKPLAAHQTEPTPVDDRIAQASSTDKQLRFTSPYEAKRGHFGHQVIRHEDTMKLSPHFKMNYRSVWISSLTYM